MTGTRCTVSSSYKLPSSGRGRRCRLPADPTRLKGSRFQQLTGRSPCMGGRQISRGAVVPCHACAGQWPQSSAALVRRVATALRKRCNQEEKRQLSHTQFRKVLCRDSACLPPKPFAHCLCESGGFKCQFCWVFSEDYAVGPSYQLLLLTDLWLPPREATPTPQNRSSRHNNTLHTPHNTDLYTQTHIMSPPAVSKVWRCNTTLS